MKQSFMRGLGLWILVVTGIMRCDLEHLTLSVYGNDNFSYHYGDSSSQDQRSGFYFNVHSAAYPTSPVYEQYRQQQLENMIMYALLEAHLGPAVAKAWVAQQHYKAYGMSYDELWGKGGLYKPNNFDTVVKSILDRKHLTKEQALAVWQGYCNKRYFHWGKKAAGFVTIIEAYDLRAAQEAKIKQQQLAAAQQQRAQSQAAAQAASSPQPQLPTQVQPAVSTPAPLQQATAEPARIDLKHQRFRDQKEIVAQHLQQLGLDPDQTVYLHTDFETLQQEYDEGFDLCHAMLSHDPDNIWRDRWNALRDSVDQEYQQSWHDINLSPQAQGLLNAYGIAPAPYQTCYGTTMQHHLHQETCNLLEAIAQAQLEKTAPSLFFTNAMHCVDASYWANQFEHIALTIGLNDLASACCDMGSWVTSTGRLYGKAVVEGVVESATEFVHMVGHPVQTVANLAKATWFVTETVLLLAAPKGLKARQDRIDMIETIVSAMIDQARDSSGPERAKMATKFVVDCIFQHKAMQAVGAVAGVLRARVGTLRTIEYVADIMGQEAELATAAESIAQATQEVESLVQKSVIDSVAKAKPAGSIPVRSKIFNVEELVAKIRKHGGKVSFRDTVLKNNLDYWVSEWNKLIRTTIDPSILDLCQKMTRIPGNPGISVCMDIEHIVNGAFSVIKDKSGAFYEVVFKGGHLGGTMKKLEKAGVVKIHSAIEFGKGCVEYLVEDLFSGRLFQHTEYPLHWNAEKIVTETMALYTKAVQEMLVDFSKTKPIEMMTSEGFNLKMIADKAPIAHQCTSIEGTLNKHIITAHPYYKRLP